ncbi:MAG: hypothetical protein VW868_07905, partial [Bacteroidota bacterium]
IFDGNQLTGVPKTQFYQQLRFNGIAGLGASITHQYQSRLALDDENSVFAQAHHLFNGQFSWTYRWGTRLETKAYVSLENLSDLNYSLGYDRPLAFRHPLVFILPLAG